MAKLILALLAAFSIIALALVPPAVAERDTLKAGADVSFSPATKMFVIEAANDDLLAMETSRLPIAVDDEHFKAFAHQLILGHSRMVKELEKIVNGKVSSFTVPSSLDKDRLSKLDKIKDLAGPEFVKEYLSLQLAIHQAAVARFERYRQDGDNADMKAFAEKHLAQLREYQQTAQKLLDGM